MKKSLHYDRRYGIMQEVIDGKDVFGLSIIVMSKHICGLKEWCPMVFLKEDAYGRNEPMEVEKWALFQ